MVAQCILPRRPTASPVRRSRTFCSLAVLPSSSTSSTKAASPQDIVTPTQRRATTALRLTMAPATRDAAFLAAVVAAVEPTPRHRASDPLTTRMPAVARLVAWAAAWAAAAVVASGPEPLQAARWDIFSETGIAEATGRHTATQAKDRTPPPRRIHPAALALQVTRTRPAVLEAPEGGSQEQVGQTLVITHTFCLFVITSPLQAA